MNFSCDDRTSVSSMMKNDEKIMNFDRFMYTQAESGVRRSSIRKTSNLDRDSVGFLVAIKEGLEHPIEYLLGGNKNIKKNLGL